MGSVAAAVRAVRRVAFEIESLFDAARGGTGSDPADAVKNLRRVQRLRRDRKVEIKLHLASLCFRLEHS